MMVARYPKGNPSIFARMTALAAEAHAINLAQGVPDFDGPPALFHNLTAATRAGWNQYSATAGTPDLRRAVSLLATRNGAPVYDWENEVTITSGCMEALSAALLALLQPGDEVIVLEPFFDPYPILIGAAGARMVGVPLVVEDGRFGLEIDLVKNALTPQTRAILLNSPHNPTGMMLSETELSRLAALAQEADLLVVSDEVYEHITYDGRVHRSIAALPGMRERTVIVSSASKTFSITGWRIGWVLGPDRLCQMVHGGHMHMSFCAPTPLQVAVAKTINWAVEKEYFTRFRLDYQRKRDAVVDAVVAAGLEPLVPEGTFFVLARSDCATVDETHKLCERLIRDAGVAVLPTDSFFSDPKNGAGLLRLVCCKRDEVLTEARDRLVRWRSSDARTRATRATASQHEKRL